MVYLLSNICTKHYWNRTTIVETIVGGWVVSFFDTQCRRKICDKKTKGGLVSDIAVFVLKRDVKLQPTNQQKVDHAECGWMT